MNLRLGGFSLTVFFLLSLSTADCHARLYKCIDKQGKVVYQDGSCSANIDEGKLVVQDQGSGKVYGRNPDEGADQKAMKEYLKIMAEGKCSDRRIPWESITTKQRQVLVDACRTSKPYQERERSDEISREKDKVRRALRIGMTADQVLSAKGQPYKVNKTTTAQGVSEQWVYGNGTFTSGYVYLNNGILTAFQD